MPGAPLRAGPLVEYAAGASAPPSYDQNVLLGAATACGLLHVALATASVLRMMTQPGLSFSGFWVWYYGVDAVCRTVLAALLVAGAVGVWGRRRPAMRYAVWAAVGLIALGAIELVVSLVGYVSGPPRPNDLAGVVLSVAATFLNRYGPLVLLVYVLVRPRRPRAARTEV